MIHWFRNQLGSIRSVYLRNNKIYRHNDFAEFPETDLLLHGFFQTRNIWEVMERRLRRDGYGVISLDLGGLFWRYNTKSIDHQGKFLASKMEGICSKYNLKHFHIIGHSMGGLIARQYIQFHGGSERVKSLITLGTPHHGTPIAALGIGLMGGGLLSQSPLQMLPNSRFLKRLHQQPFPPSIPLTSIYSKQDYIASWWGSVLRPHQNELYKKNIIIPNVGHTELTHHSGVYMAIKSELDTACTLFTKRNQR